LPTGRQSLPQVGDDDVACDELDQPADDVLRRTEGTRRPWCVLPVPGMRLERGDRTTMGDREYSGSSSERARARELREHLAVARAR
jgi:hypothetical protein